MDDQKQALNDLRWAADFDPEDPDYGLRWEDLSSDRITRRTALRLAIVAGASRYLTRFLNPPPAFAQGAPGGELRAGWVVRDFTNLDPAFINQAVQFQVMSNVLGGLTHIDKDLIPRGDLAEKWEVSRDGKVWTFNLRRGVKWHNGDTFTADDVVFTYNRTLDPKTGSIHRGALAPIEKLEKVDANTVRITLKAASASFLMKVLERSSGRALTIVNRRAIESMGKDGHNRRPVGTGPFRIGDHRFGERLVLDKFGGYFLKGRPMVDRVTIFNIEEPSTLVSGLEAGRLDFIAEVPEALFMRVKGNPNVVISDAPDPGFQAIFFNLRKDKKEKIGRSALPTDDVRVRLAMAKAIDRNELIQRALLGRGIPGYGPVPAAQTAYFRDLSRTSPQRYDLEAARKLMAEAMYPNGFPIKMLISTAVRRRGEVIADMLRRALNIQVELDVVDFPVQVQRYFGGAAEMCQIGSAGDPDPDDSIDDWYATRSKFNVQGYSNPEVDRLNDLQKQTLDVKLRAQYVQQILEHLGRDVPSAFLFHNIDSAAFRKNVRGFVHIPGLRDLDTVTVK